MDWPCTDEPDDFGTCSEGCVDGFGDDQMLDDKGDCPSCGLSFATFGVGWPE